MAGLLSLGGVDGIIIANLDGGVKGDGKDEGGGGTVALLVIA